MPRRTPVVFLVFNRPEQTSASFAQIRRSRPSELFLVADGPRETHPDDNGRCAAVRSIIDQVDWPCEVHRDFAETNMGLKHRVSSGLDWVFSQADRAIIVEDDCLPHADFFEFCETLLDRFRDDERVGHITGNNLQHGIRRGSASYYFSKYPNIWGWATWRRAWRHYDRTMAFWPEWRESADWRAAVPNRIERRYWERAFDGTYSGEIGTWDYQWTAANWLNGFLTATPNVNLVANIGFGPDATHTTKKPARAHSLSSLGAITHPSEIVRDVQADDYTFRHHFTGRYGRMRLRLLLAAEAVGPARRR